VTANRNPERRLLIIALGPTANHLATNANLPKLTKRIAGLAERLDGRILSLAASTALGA